ncbi:MAG TPA: hypothetical protein VEY32_08775 [Flavisolibacter sp.]|nr:hypothetical protein [Flavisolibacter sp.]
MRALHIVLLMLGIFSCSLGCSNKETIVQKQEQTNITKSEKQDTDIIVKNNNNKDITKLSYEESLMIYGKPISKEEFENAKEGEVFPGIRAGIGKFYPPGKEIIIKEAIWNKNDTMEIAVWYTHKQNHWIPFSYFEYDKNTDF